MSAALLLLEEIGEDAPALLEQGAKNIAAQLARSKRRLISR